MPPTSSDAYLGAVGLLFMMFFLVAAATEAILETFRGVLERIGLTWLKSNDSFEDAIKLSTEFLPSGSEARGKIAALDEAVKKTKKLTDEKKQELETLKKEINGLVANSKIDDALTAKVNLVAMHVKKSLDASERQRVFWLRMISAVIAIILCYMSKFDALNTMLKSYPDLFVLDSIDEHLGIILTGIAAASGSSYWHDKLDKIRNLKNVQDQVRKLAS